MQVLMFTRPLYRADAFLGNFQLPTTADQVYGVAFNKYFTLLAGETEPYQRRGNQMHIYTWIPTRALKLVDMFSLGTRNTIYTNAPPHVQVSLDRSFPVIHGVVRRVSEAHAVEDDNICLQHICDLGFDGYIAQMREGNTFHSEVGICRNSLQYLELQERGQPATVPPAVAQQPNAVSRVGTGMQGMRLAFGGKRHVKHRKSRRHTRRAKRFTRKH